MKMTKKQADLHQQACALLNLDRPLTADEQEFVLTHWQESATPEGNVLAGAFFTPLGLARDMAWEAEGPRIVDLCAGIGRIGWSVPRFPQPWRVVCVERDPRYVEIGRRVFPDAEWVCADVFDPAAIADLTARFGRFDTAIANPPYGAVPRTGNGPRYTGRRTEYHVIDVASQVADHGVFLIPQTAAPFSHSGRAQTYRDDPDAEYGRFRRQTGISLDLGLTIDTGHYDGEWHGVSPCTEIVVCDFRHPGPEAAASAVPVTAAGEQLEMAL